MEKKIDNSQPTPFKKGCSFIKLTWITLILFVALFGFARSSWAGDYYVSTVTRGSGNCSSWANSCTIANIPWSTIDNNGTDNTIYLDGGTNGLTYGPLSVNIPYTDNTLYIRPGSYSSQPSSHDGLVTFTTADNADNEGTGVSFIRNVVFNGQKASTCIPTDLYGEGCRNIKIGPTGGEGIYLHSAASNIKILYTEITDTGRCYYANESNPYCTLNIGSQMEAITVDNSCTNCEVAYNYVHYTWVKGIKLQGPGNNTYGSVNIHHNMIYETSDDALVCANNCDIDDNYIDCATENGALSYNGHPDGLQVDSRYINYMRIRNNYFTGCTQLIFFEADCMYTGNCEIKNILIANNVLDDRRNDPNMTFPGIALGAKGG